MGHLVECACISFSVLRLGLAGASVRRCAMRTFRARAGGGHFFFRSKFGLAGASVRRCAMRTFRARAGGGHFFFRSKFGFAEASVRRCAMRTFRARAGGGHFFFRSKFGLARARVRRYAGGWWFSAVSFQERTDEGMKKGCPIRSLHSVIPNLFRNLCTI